MRLHQSILRGIGLLLMLPFVGAAQTITGANIVNGSIGTADLANGSVTTSKIANGSVTTGKIALQAVTADQLGDEAVTRRTLARNVVVGRHIANGAITEAKLHSTLQDLLHVVLDGTITANTDEHNRVDITSGGFGVLQLDTTVAGSRPWIFAITDNGLANGTAGPAGSLALGILVDGSTGGVGGGPFFTQFIFTPTGQFVQPSDTRLKTNIVPLTNTLNKLSQVRGVEFEWNDTAGPSQRGQRSIGVIAQEVEAVFPELVVNSEQEGYKAVEYAKFTSVLIEAVKELRSEKEAQITALTARLERLEQTVGKTVAPLQSSSFLSSNWLLFSGLFLAGMIVGQYRRFGDVSAVSMIRKKSRQ